MTEAFTARRGSHWFARRPLPVDDPAATWEALLHTPRSGKTVAYLHVPFCESHCLFCGFYRHGARDGFSAPYAAMLVRDLEREAGSTAQTSGPIHAVYLGGGTPTALDAPDLHAVITAARTHLPLTPDCEITVEGRVHGFDDEMITACLEAGANRFSIGIQTFNTAVRHRLGRKADRDAAERLLAGLVARDRAAVICDLIYGLPGQTLETWRDDVRTAIELGLDGVDLYALTLVPHSPLAQSIDKGAQPSAPPLADHARFYGAGLDLLDTAGWRHLSQAHWARTTRERNLYNQSVKEQAHCLAFGAGAGGLLAGHRYRLEPDEALYRHRIAADEKPLAALFAPASDPPARAAVAASLESGRMAPDHLETLAGAGFAARLAPLLDHWTEAGLVAPAPGGVALTRAGWFWQPNLIGALMALIPDDARPPNNPGTGWADKSPSSPPSPHERTVHHGPRDPNRDQRQPVHL
nr:heme anaerobic degradation radical SAM methyltransferase ChuW/HutW [Roseospira visakhapatnamensis]